MDLTDSRKDNLEFLFIVYLASVKEGFNSTQLSLFCDFKRALMMWKKTIFNLY